MLDREQEDLLAQLVTAAQSVPREDREFFYFASLNGEEICGPGDFRLQSHGQMLRRDIDALQRHGLLRTGGQEHSINFIVTPEGFARVRDSTEPLERQENTVRRYLHSEGFRESFPSVYKKWADAEALLWQDDYDDQLSTIGHKMREAVQDFATTLVEEHGPPDVNTSVTAVSARVRAVLSMYQPKLGERRRELVLALIDYWSAAVDVIHRQTKGEQKGNEPLTWLDGRRVVFHTASVMFEIAAILEDLYEPPQVAVLESGH
jgi:hypothetical protein